MIVDKLRAWGYGQSIMIRASLLLLAGFVVMAVAGVSFASEAPHETRNAAAEAAFVDLLPDWDIAGECDKAITPVPKSVCYGFGPGRSTEDYTVYGAHAFRVLDTGWWAGVIETGEGWKSYGAGRCDIFYCRMAAPGDVVLVGYPNGNVDCLNGTTSQDALLILQVVAKLIAQQDLPCWFESANVYTGGGGGSLDALAILQSEAGLIGALPVPQ